MISKIKVDFPLLYERYLNNIKNREINDDSFVEFMFEDELFSDCFLFLEETPEYESLKDILQIKEKELINK